VKFSITAPASTFLLKKEIIGKAHSEIEKAAQEEKEVSASLYENSATFVLIKSMTT
jgi:sRNA-binding carbon storage regulator CsrA